MRKTIIIAASLLLVGCQSGYVEYTADLARNDSVSYVQPHRTGSADLRLSYNIDINSEFLDRNRKPVKKDSCSLTWQQHAKVIATSTMMALANRNLRGSDNEVTTLLGGSSIAGIAIPNAVAFLLHSGDFRTYLGYTASSIAMESFQWAAALDMGQSEKIRETHHFYNRGNRTEDTFQMGMHLMRWHALPMKVLEVSNGYLDDSYKWSHFYGALGYQLGDRMRKYSKTKKVFPIRNAPIYTGELIHGFGFGYGLAKSLECQR